MGTVAGFAYQPSAMGFSSDGIYIERAMVDAGNPSFLLNMNVLAHEMGHYKKKHVIYNIVLSLLLTGFTLFILSLLVGNSLLSQALGVETASFHIGLIAFTILYSPISEITSLFMNILSRKFEYEANDYAKNNFSGKSLISALKKLSKNSLSNLTPNNLYVKIHYSHPTILQRILNLKK